MENLACAKNGYTFHNLKELNCFGCWELRFLYSDFKDKLKSNLINSVLLGKMNELKNNVSNIENNNEDDISY